MEYTTLDKISENLDSKRKPITSSDREEGSIPYYGASGIVDYVKDYIFDESLLLVSEDGANLLARSTPIAFSVSGKTWINNHAHVLRFSNQKLQKYVEIYLNSISLESYVTGSAQPKLNQKMLNEIPIPVADDLQIDLVVDSIDKIKKIIEQRKQELACLDELIKARFVEMFYDKGYPVLKWNDVFNTTTGKLDSNAAVEDGEYPFFTCSKEALRIDKFAFDQEALLLAGNNAAGKYDVKYYKGKFNAYQRTYILGLKEDWSYQLFRYQLEDKLVYLQQQSLGGLTKYLTMKILGELYFIIPPMERQIEFEEFAKQVDKSKVAVQKSLDETQQLFDSLMQEYFG